MDKKYKIISIDLQKNLVEFLDEIQFDAAANTDNESMQRINFCSYAIKELLNSVSAPKSFVMTVNAGAISEEHWIQDPKIGGGRIIGEACHFIDLLLFLAGVPIEKYDRISMQSLSSDTVSLQLGFADGSIGTIHYLSNGNKAFPKERLEVFAGGQVLQLDNFRKLTGFGWPNFRKMNLWQQNKGQKNCVKTFVSAIEKRSPAPIAFEEILEVSRISIELSEISV